MAIAKLNLRTRVGNKVYIKLSQANTPTFDDLFDLIYNIDWSYYIKENSPINITASSKNSTLHSTPAIQGIAKKAIIKKLLG
ncbi:hypothetical protein KKG31_02935 [Patescibacteria group bacterium]|nr:hypothetical protein [Patescibacteria group bacterium]MBU1758117.1 hypothetical protein [Patescibacteria group bacterium]